MEVIESKWYKKDGASSASIDDVEKLLNTTLPKQYKSFLLWSNGGEGKLGDNYIYIWAIEDVIAYNHDYGIQKYLQKSIGHLVWMVILGIFFTCLTIVYIE